MSWSTSSFLQEGILSWDVLIHAVPVAWKSTLCPSFPCFPGGVTQGSAITVSRCRSFFLLAGLWYHVMESRFRALAATLQTALFWWQPEDEGLKLEAGEQGVCLPVASLFGETGISESPQLSTTALSSQRGEGYWGWELSLYYVVVLAAVGSEVKQGAGLPAEQLISYIMKNLHSAHSLC